MNVHPVESCPGCGDDIVIKRASSKDRMCPSCQAKARAHAKKLAKAHSKPEPANFVCGDCHGTKKTSSGHACFTCA